MKQKQGLEDTLELTRRFTFNPKLGIDNPALCINDDQETVCSSKPRVCHLHKRNVESFGFYLRQELETQGHVIRQVERFSPAERSGLQDGDRVVEINGEFVDEMKHFKVVQKIKASGNDVTFTVLDSTTYMDIKAHKGSVLELISDQNTTHFARPRLCIVEKDNTGFGFSISSQERMKGHFTLSVQKGGPAERAGILPDDILLEVNGVTVKNLNLSQLSRKIKESRQVIVVLVVDSQSEVFYQEKGIKITASMADATWIPFKPRKLYMVKGTMGYGFLLRQEASKSGRCGHFLKEVDEGYPAEGAGMMEGDRLLMVNNENVEDLDHENVVQRVKQSGNQVTLVVISAKGDAFYNSIGLSPLLFYEDEKPNSPSQSMHFTTPSHELFQHSMREEEEDQTIQSTEVNSMPLALQTAPSKPRLCQMNTGTKGYGFHLYTVSDEPEIYVQQVWGKLFSLFLALSEHVKLYS
ncbi:Na(+)/H(+) exchange regulatory cofactor NHE-RF4 [Protopterus annectens]|uniref:Na(+)/H(+) exchange regulatory cofactor NHE-RF4 n=1 Tax=Protopterus annectens TaxID=7888 RepID=UPI001CFBB98B|nr:Na(+)/H(+) exchange regulatory cofactor NHE-RF4 [Protopterus annectens]